MVAEVWGPFNKTSSIDLQSQLWKQLVNENPLIQEFHFLSMKKMSCNKYL